MATPISAPGNDPEAGPGGGDPVGMPAMNEGASILDRVIGWSLGHKLLTIIAAVGILIGGGAVALTIPVDVFPDLTAPTVTVLAEAHGMAAEEVERLVTFPIETAVNGFAPLRPRVSASSG